MRRVKNRKTIRKLSINTLKSNKKRNVVIMLSIMLTCILFTSLFSIGISIMESTQETTMRQVGGRTMAGIKCILPQDYEKLKTDSAVKNPTYRIVIGNARNTELLKLSTEINYAQDRDAREMFCYPTEGTMPKDRLELATSTLVLDALGLPYKLGEKVSLKISVKGKIMNQDFTLCGYWKGDPVSQAQQCWLSRTYCDEVAPTPASSFYDSDKTDYAGYWMMDFDFSNSWNIEGKTIALLERNGYDPNKQGYGINWAYTSSSVDTQTIILIVGLLAMILLSGYLIIYNVFYINVSADIKKYGLLKTIGTTGKQLKSIVWQQAMILSLLGIPFGLAAGTVLSKLLLPVIMDNFSIGNMKFSISPVIYLLSAAFTFLTVWVSSRKPCGLAAKVSPIEAIRYTERNVPKKKEKKISRVSAFSMAMGNIKRTRKKVVVVVLSLSLSMILVNSVYSIVNSLDVDKYVSTSIIGDFAVTDATVPNLSIMDRNFSGVSKKVKEELSKIDGVESVSNIYCKDNSKMKLEGKGYDKFNQFAAKQEELTQNENDKQELDYYRKNKFISCTIYGMGRTSFERLELQEGSLDWDKFASGNYAVIYTYDLQLDEEEASDASFYKIGDNVPLELPDGTVKEYEVMAIANIPYAMTNKAYYLLGANAVIPEEEYLKHTADSGALYSILKSADGKIDYVDSYLEKYTKDNPELTYVSKQSYVDEFNDFIRMFWIVGGALSIILALIGILNFMNAIVTSLLARKQEFAMLEAVGMTGKQLKIMLICEGNIYAFLTVLFSVTLGSVIGYWLIRAVAGQIWFFSYHFTLMPIGLCIPVLIILSCLIPYISYHSMSKISIVDRLKIIE